LLQIGTVKIPLRGILDVVKIQSRKAFPGLAVIRCQLQVFTPEPDGPAIVLHGLAQYRHVGQIALPLAPHGQDQLIDLQCFAPLFLSVIQHCEVFKIINPPAGIQIRQGQDFKQRLHSLGNILHGKMHTVF
jgi:hypothetical protein